MSTIEALRPNQPHSAIHGLRHGPGMGSVDLAATRRESLSSILGPARLAGLMAAFVASILMTGWALYGPETESRATHAAQRLGETSSSSPRSIMILLTAALALALLAGRAAWKSHRTDRG